MDKNRGYSPLYLGQDSVVQGSTLCRRGQIATIEWERNNVSEIDKVGGQWKEATWCNK